MKTKNYHIYIIEDNAFFAKLLEEKILMQTGYDVQVFSTGEEALSTSDFNPDIVILDYFLSIKDDTIMNGSEITEKIRHQKPNIPIIILSAQEKIDVAIDLLNQGACDYIEKNDYAIENVLNSIQKITQLKNARLEINSLRKKSRQDKIRMSLIFMLMLISLSLVFCHYR